MALLKEKSRYIRSKNAGPFWATIDIFCDSEEDYLEIKGSKNVTAATVARLYSVPESSVKTFYIDSIFVVKFSFPRISIQGHKYENDMHFGQQYLLMSAVTV
jgi:hypothetical protein